MLRDVVGMGRLQRHASELLGYFERNEDALVHYTARRRRGGPLEGGWVRRKGGGRKTLLTRDLGLLSALLALVSPTERGSVSWEPRSWRDLTANRPSGLV